MLVLTRKSGQRVIIDLTALIEAVKEGKEVVPFINITNVGPLKARIGFEADPLITIAREELLQSIASET